MDRFAAFQRLITEPDLAVEGKGKDPITCPNRMHVLLAAEDGSAVLTSKLDQLVGASRNNGVAYAKVERAGHSKGARGMSFQQLRSVSSVSASRCRRGGGRRLCIAQTRFADYSRAAEISHPDDDARLVNPHPHCPRSGPCLMSLATPPRFALTARNAGHLTLSSD